MLPELARDEVVILAYFQQLPERSIGCGEVVYFHFSFLMACVSGGAIFHCGQSPRPFSSTILRRSSGQKPSPTVRLVGRLVWECATLSYTHIGDKKYK